MPPKGERKAEKPDPCHVPQPKHFGYVLKTSPPWVRVFYDEHWGKGGGVPTEIIEFDDIPVQVVDEAALPSNVHHPMMVKEEYPVILKKLEDQLDGQPRNKVDFTRNQDGRAVFKLGGPTRTSKEPLITQGLCIFGHTGSGKTTSLIYLLIAMLRRKQSVLFVESSLDNAIIFTGTFIGVVCKNYVATLCTHGWPLVILYDATADVIPVQWYGDAKTNSYIVLATSPPIKRFSHWMKSGVECLTMEPFTKHEFSCLSAANTDFDKSPGFHSALVMYDYLGPSLKVLKKRKVKILADSSVENDFAASTTRLFEDIFHAPTGLWSESAAYNWIAVGTDRDPPAYHRFFIVRPIRDAERWTQDPSYTLDLITDFMGLVFISAVQKKNKHMAFAKHFMTSPSMRGLFYKMSTIRYLSYAVSPSTVFMVPNTENLEVPSFLTTHEMLLDFGKSPPKRQRLHISPIGAATIDALYEMQDGTTLLFQMTTAKKHLIADVGLKKILECYRREDSEIGYEKFVLVFVVPDQESKDQYLRTWSEGKQVKIVGEQPQLLRVGVIVINPLQAKPLEEIIREHIYSHPDKRTSKMITKEGKLIDFPTVLPSTPRPVKSSSPSQSVSITYNQKIFFTSPKISPVRTRATAPSKRVNATREGAEDAPGPSKRARLDADDVPAESSAPVAAPVMENEGEHKGKGKSTSSR